MILTLKYHLFQLVITLITKSTSKVVFFQNYVFPLEQGNCSSSFQPHFRFFLVK